LSVNHFLQREINILNEYVAIIAPLDAILALISLYCTANCNANSDVYCQQQAWF